MDELVNVLVEAFPPKPLYEPSAFGDPAGMWGGYLDAEAFESHIQGKSWDMLEPSFLEFHHDALAYFGPDAFVAVLPAYLVALIRHDDTLNMLSPFLLLSLRRKEKARSQAIFDARVARMTEHQRAAVTQVLEGLAQSARHAD
jgi:hypothetical protein